MDYDDNDFQSQNLHLAGEGSTKFPPVLRPYALSNFDDSLPGHLRFDSLVETEVFLGIESNEDNQWIEDFSRGNTGIEFSSSAAESCSILRRNNVWSEATSSESVEMLLKSVGQEDIIPEQIVTGELNAYGKLACLTKQMDPTLKHDNSIFSEGTGNMDSQLMSLPDESLERFSCVNVNVGQEQPCNDDAPHTKEAEISVDGSSTKVDPSVASKSGGLDTTEGNPANDGNSKLTTESNVDSQVDMLLDDKGQDDPSASQKHIDDVVPSIENIITDGGNLNSQKVEHQINDKTGGDTDVKQVDNSNPKEVCAFSEELHVEDQHCLLSSSMGKVMEESKVVEARSSKVEEHFRVIPKGDTSFDKGEGCDEVVCPEICSDAVTCNEKVLCRDLGTGNESKVSMHDVIPVVLKSDARDEGHAVETSYTDSGNSANPEPNIDSTVQISITDEHHIIQLKSEVLVDNSGLSFSVVEDNKVYGDSEGACTHKGDIPNLPVISCSDKLPGETHTVSSLTAVHGAYEVPKGNLSTEEPMPSITLVESAQVSEEKLNMLDDVCAQDVTITGKDNPSLTSSVSMDCQVTGNVPMVKGVESSSFGEGNTDSELANKKMRCDTRVGDEPALVIVSEGPSVATSQTVYGVLLPSGDIATADGSVHHKEQSLPEGAGCNTETQSDLQAEVAMEVSQDSKQDMDIVHMLIHHDSTAQVCDSAEAVSDTNLDQRDKCMPAKSLSLPLEETSNDAGQENQENIEAKSSSGEKNGGQALASKPSGDSGTIEDPISYVPIAEFHASTLEGGVCADVAKPAFDSPKATGSNVSKDENRKEGVEDLKSENIQLPEDINASVSNVIPISQDSKGDGGSKSERSRAIDPSLLVDLTKGDDVMHRPLAATSASKVSPIVEGSLSTSGLGQRDLKNPQDTSYGSPLVSDVAVLGRSKGTSERKSRRASAKGPGKEPAKKGTPSKQSEKGNKSIHASLSPSGIFQLVQPEMQHHGHVESSSTKPFVFLPTSTSTLPDLNNSASSSAMFQQPFTDVQQMQLRAQIFVYGALIQGTAPDEAYMLSAFGGVDGGRTMWENGWRMCMERLHGQKSHPVSSETAPQSSPGSKGTDQAMKQIALQGKVASTPVSRTSSKGTPTAVNPMISLPSPLWSISTPSSEALQSTAMPRGSVMDYQQSLTPLQSYQTTPARNFIGPNASWLSQSPFRSPWVASPQTSAIDSSIRFSALPITEPVHLTHVKESAVLQSSGVKSSGPIVHTAVRTNVVPAASSLSDPKKGSATPGKNSSDPKPRRRKKNPPEEPGLVAIPSQPQLEPVLIPTVSSNLSTSVTIKPPTGFAFNVSSEKLITPASPLPSIAPLKQVGHDVKQRASLSEDTLGKVKEARQLAEDAALSASEAVKHSQEIWSQLSRQKNSGLVSEVESKVASAAVAIAAASAVAKAAAAAANVASNAASQAKLMADESLISAGFGNSSQSNESSLYGNVNSLGNATPSSILKGVDGANTSTSVIFATREAARKRVEAASAASKRAENLDSIVKAAELAAEAVSQAGIIVCMGEPPSFSHLVEAGPEGYWKVAQVSSELNIRTDEVNQEQLGIDGIGELVESSAKQSKGGQSDMDGNDAPASGKLPIPGEMSEVSIENHTRLVDTIPGSSKDLRVLKSRKVSGLEKTIDVVPESEVEARYSQSDYEESTDLKEGSIKEGSFVEVLKNGNGLKSAWFTANVLSLEEGKVYVCYTELQPEQGSGQLKEWVTLEEPGDQAPKVRISRPIASVQYGGTRKRQRAAVGEYTWSIGDRVDGWIQDRWWEGVVTEKNSKDETTLIVHFPAQAETHPVKTWHLRPSLFWKDGQWVEWSSSIGNDFSHESDMPREKRPKLGTPAVEAKGKDKTVDAAESKYPEDPILLALSEKDKVFNVGKNTRNDNKSNPLRTNRTGLQEGSRVVFGVPKPGKKRKFMEVSKHYVAADHRNRMNEANDSVKLAKYMLPQAAGSRGARTTFKAGLKEKQTEFKPKSIRSGKPPVVSGRTIPQKEKTMATTVSVHPDGSRSDHATNVKDSESHVENVSENRNFMDTGSYSSTGATPDGQILLSSLAHSSDAHLSKKISSLNPEPERASEGKLAPAGGKLAKIEERGLNGSSGKSASDIEPRRSNRRIQPTSRLLEGLQSSLTISKIPYVSHDKSRSHRK